MNDRFSKTCLAMIVGLLVVIAFNPCGKKPMPPTQSHRRSGGGGAPAACGGRPPRGGAP